MTEVPEVVLWYLDFGPRQINPNAAVTRIQV